MLSMKHAKRDTAALALQAQHCIFVCPALDASDGPLSTTLSTTLFLVRSCMDFQLGSLVLVLVAFKQQLQQQHQRDHQQLLQITFDQGSMYTCHRNKKLVSLSF